MFASTTGEGPNGSPRLAFSSHGHGGVGTCVAGSPGMVQIVASGFKSTMGGSTTYNFSVGMHVFVVPKNSNMRRAYTYRPLIVKPRQYRVTTRKLKASGQASSTKRGKIGETAPKVV